MFNKKRCKKCGEKNNSKARFCSTCGFNFERGDSEDYGMLGKDDFTENSFNDPFTSSFFGGFSEKMLSKMMGSAMKMLEREMQKGMKEQDRSIKTNFRLMINGKEIPLNQGPIQKKKKVEEKKLTNTFSNEKLKQLSKLPKKEPKTTIRRIIILST